MENYIHDTLLSDHVYPCTPVSFLFKQDFLNIFSTKYSCVWLSKVRNHTFLVCIFGCTLLFNIAKMAANMP